MIEHSIARIGVGPRRLGYLVDSGNKSQVENAVEYATTEWGGMGHPIIPIDSSGHVATGYLQIAETIGVEALIAYSRMSDDVLESLASKLSARLLREDEMRFREPGVHSLVTAPASSLAGQSILAPRSSESLMQRIALGIVPEDQRSLYEEAGAILESQFSDSRFLAAQLSDESLLGLTLRAYTAFEVSNFWGDVVLLFCFPRMGLRQAIWFWNIRALSIPRIDPSKFVLATPQMLRTSEAKRLIQSACLDKPLTVPDLFLLGSSRGGLESIGVELGFKRSAKGKISRTFAARRTGRDLSEAPLTFEMNIDPRLMFLGVRKGGRQIEIPVTVQDPDFTIHFPAPVRFDASVSGFIRVDINDVLAIDWPKRDSVAKLVHDDARFTRDGLSFVRSPSRTFRFSLRVPSPAQVTTALLADRGWDWRLSDKGKYASALLAKSAGQRTTAMRSATAYRIAERLVSPNRRKAQQILIRAGSRSGITQDERQQLLTRAASVGAPVWRTAGEVGSDLRMTQSKVLHAMASLVACGLLKRGLRFECSECGLSSVFPLTDSADILPCPGCGTRAPLIGPGSTEPVFVYSLNSLLDRALDQDCVSHLLALDHLIDSGDAEWGVPGAEVFSDDGVSREVDILAVSRTELIVGEIKRSPGHLTQTALRSTLSLAVTIGAGSVVFGSLGSHDPGMVERFANAAGRANLQCRVLDQQSLLVR